MPMNKAQAPTIPNPVTREAIARQFAEIATVAYIANPHWCLDGLSLALEAIGRQWIIRRPDEREIVLARLAAIADRVALDTPAATEPVTH